MNAVRYLEIMERMLLPRLQMRGYTNYQQDSAPCHTVKICKAWFAENNVPLLPWPGNSPYLNPVENMICGTG